MPNELEAVKQQMFMQDVQIKFIREILISTGTCSPEQFENELQKYLKEKVGMPDANGKMPGKLKINFY